MWDIGFERAKINGGTVNRTRSNHPKDYFKKVL